MWHYVQCTCSPELEGGSWEICSSDTLPSAPSRSRNTPGKSCSGDRPTDTSRGSRFGMMSPPSTEPHGRGRSMSSAAGFPARIFPLPGRAPESTGNGLAFGAKWPEWLAKYDPDSSSWRTRQCSLLGDLEEFSETWPRWGFMRDGECWALTTPGPRTSGTGSGYWRSPDTGAGGTSGLLKQGKDFRENGQPIQIRLIDQVNNPRLWPTPKSSPSGPDFARMNREKSGGDDLATAVARPWATPSARDWKDTPGMATEGTNPDGTKRTRTDQLARQVYAGGTSTRQTYPTPTSSERSGRNRLTGRGEGLFWVVRDMAGGSPRYPTPTRNDYKNAGYQMSGEKTYPTLPGAVGSAKYPTPTSVSGNNIGTMQEWGGKNNPTRGTAESKGQLNPDWVEYLMGWPISWTSQKPLTAGRFHRWLQASRIV